MSTIRSRYSISIRVRVLFYDGSVSIRPVVGGLYVDGLLRWDWEPYFGAASSDVVVNWPGSERTASWGPRSMFLSFLFGLFFHRSTCFSIVRRVMYHTLRDVKLLINLIKKKNTRTTAGRLWTTSKHGTFFVSATNVFADEPCLSRTISKL